MMTGKQFWMTSAAVLALTATANAAQPANSAADQSQAKTAWVQVAQNMGQNSAPSGSLEDRVSALEAQLATQNDRATSDRTRLSTLEQSYNSASWTFDNGRPVLSSGDGRFTMAIRVRFQAEYAGFQQSTTHPANFSTGAFTGRKTGTAATHGNNGDENAQVLGRVTDRLWSDGISNFQIGASAAKALYTGNSAGGGAQTLNFQDRPEIRVDGTRLVSTGGIAAKTGNMWAVDLGGNYENFFLGGEYAQFTADRQCGTTLTVTNNARCVTSTSVIDHPRTSGWYVEGSWILTGETKAYSASAINNEVGGFNAPIPSRPFSLNGNSWGAFELVARYSNTNLNWMGSQAAVTNTLGTSNLAGILGGDENILALGLNWYMNRNVRLMIDDNIVMVKKGSLAIPTRDSQNLNIVGVRLQFAN